MYAASVSKSYKPFWQQLSHFIGLLAKQHHLLIQQVVKR